MGMMVHYRFYSKHQCFHFKFWW